MMPETLPFWIEYLFLGVAAITIGLFYLLNGKNKVLAFLIVLWSCIHALLAYQGFYLDTEAMPPRFVLIMIPLFLIFGYSLTGKRLDAAIENRHLRLSAIIHTVRIPIEVILLQLFLGGLIPELMTFEGRNFDILVGISAPIIVYLYWKEILSKQGLLIWNWIGLGMVLFILTNGLLSAELPIQQFGFEQPNRAVTLFPFVLLPCTIVPIVIYTHIVDIIKLKRELSKG